MITSSQIKTLSAQKQIDDLTIVREYIQIVFLNYLYQQEESAKIYFKGGTAIHLLMNSVRFSEDLDFSTPLSDKTITKAIKKAGRGLSKELPEIRILPLYKGKDSIRFRIKCELSDFKYPFNIRLDFNQKKNLKQTVSSPLATNFPVVFFSLIMHLSSEEILAEKICAFLTRAKGRDIYDLWFLLEKRTVINEKLISLKLIEAEKKYEKDLLVKKIRHFPIANLQKDLNKFLPRSQRPIIDQLKDLLLKHFT